MSKKEKRDATFLAILGIFGLVLGGLSIISAHLSYVQDQKKIQNQTVLIKQLENRPAKTIVKTKVIRIK